MQSATHWVIVARRCVRTSSGDFRLWEYFGVVPSQGPRRGRARFVSGSWAPHLPDGPDAGDRWCFSRTDLASQESWSKAEGLVSAWDAHALASELGR